MRSHFLDVRSSGAMMKGIYLHSLLHHICSVQFGDSASSALFYIYLYRATHVLTGLVVILDRLNVCRAIDIRVMNVSLLHLKSLEKPE